MTIKIIVFAAWQMNQPYIAKNLCEERSIENSDCAGACQLEKSLKATENKQDPYAPQKSLKNIEFSAFNLANTTLIAHETVRCKKVFCSTNTFLLPPSVASSIFHPPEMMVFA